MPVCSRGNRQGITMKTTGNADILQSARVNDDSAAALEKFRKPLIHYLTSGLAGQDKWVRYLAAEVLGTIRDPAAIGNLTPLLADPDGDVRAVAARALDAIGHSRPAYALLQNSSCDSCLIRIIAQEALSAHKGE